MAETTGRAIEVFERSCRPRNFDEVCVLTLDDDCAAGDLAWFNAGVDSKVRAGILGFVFELNQFHLRESDEHGVGQMVRFMLPVMRGRASLYWLHGARFVEAW